ncbi:sugar-binding transcriptional regulator [Cohnella zeiphila]|uniref:Sugar-binding domain-containing protein n=1 Tax=Cohnella zeiphila TaxID=2761120 RepID=A0A7X0SJ33_9BACL|nr:sugar-binding domain-containing protein [Cohnella zeiphila]MBB6730887.1 hypothetical protein [Cohnella zeiphila]
MKNNESLSKRSFLERIARMYYVLNLTQQEICEQLNIGRSSVARFLLEARESGIIQFQIRSDVDSMRSAALERQIASRYRLKDCVAWRSDEAANSFVSLTGQYLNSVLPSHGSVGLGWGKTLHAVGSQLHLCDPRPGLKIVQMSGGSGAKEELAPAASNVQSWAQALRGKPCFLPAPAIAAHAAAKDAFLLDPSIAEMMREIRRISVAVVGIGHTAADSTILSAHLAPELDARQLSKSGAGDVIFHFFNERGEFSNPALSRRVVGASIEDYMRIDLRIGIAHGEDKIRAILGALRGGLVHVLITTEQTAQRLTQQE